MELPTITMEKDEAAERLEAYRDALKAHEDPVYEDIARGLRWMKRDDVLGLLDLRAAITAGGVDDHGAPRLAVMQADEEWCHVHTACDGSVTFAPDRLRNVAHNRRRGVYRCSAGTLPVHTRGPDDPRWTCRQRRFHHGEMRAMVPVVPPELRPAHHLRNYEILWEVDRWERDPEPPRDPALLKHVGGHLYALLGVWDLTELERAVLAGRS